MSHALAGPVLVLHAIVTLAMTGLIWFVQIVHYPLMRRVGAAHFVAYEGDHTRRTTTVVGPLMLVEAITAVALVAARPAEVSVALAWCGVALVALLWLSTALVQVPCHRRLADGFDPDAHARLVGTNWIRTAAWSARAGIAMAMLG